MHGFALNVSPDLAGFDAINPCGIPGCPMTSLEAECETCPSAAAVKERLTARFSEMVEEVLPAPSAAVPLKFNTTGGGCNDR
jgi:lipoyl(octanoyl) transferase